MIELVLLFAMQDLFQPEESRLDLRFEADFRPAHTDPDKVTFSLPLEGDFAWFGFDLKENFRKMLSKEVKDEVLDQIIDLLIDELSDSAMTLLCQVSPTTCDNLKHYRTTTNQKMSMDLDLTRSVEEKNTDTQGSLVAGALKACLKKRRQQGDSLREAIRKCAESGGIVRTLAGNVANQYSLEADLAASLNLDPATRKLVGSLTGDRTLSGGVLKDESRRHAIGSEYDRIRSAYEADWTRLPSLTPAEIQTIREAPAGRRRAMVSALASAHALVEITRRVHEVERVLDSAASSPNADEEMKKRLAGERDTLRAELKRLAEEHAKQRLYRDTILQVVGEAERDRAERIRRTTVDQARKWSGRRTDRSTRKWGCRVKK